MRPWTAISTAHFTHAVELQWGHGLAAVDGNHLNAEPMPASKLQWGHGLAAVDGTFLVIKPKPNQSLQWGHGLAAVDGGRRHIESLSAHGFNGATALRPWTVGSSISRPNAAAAGFNGATALRPWTDNSAVVVEYRKWLQWGHGLAAVDGTCPPPCFQTPTCFNGATALRPWTA